MPLFNLKNGYDQVSLWVNSFSYHGGWSVQKYPRILADVNGDGKADIVGFGNEGVYVSLSTGVVLHRRPFG